MDMSDMFAAVTKFGFVPGRATEEAICKAPTHVDEARARAHPVNKNRSEQGFRDTVDRVRLRQALEQASADPALIEVVGKIISMRCTK